MARSLAFLSLCVPISAQRYAETEWVHIEMFDTFGDGWNGACCHVENSDGSFYDEFCLHNGEYGEHGMEVPVAEHLAYYISCDEGEHPWESAWVAWTEAGEHLTGKLGWSTKIEPSSHGYNADCDSCAQQFAAEGGCRIWRDCEEFPDSCDHMRLLDAIPDFCDGCEERAAEVCFGENVERCDDCVNQFMEQDLCHIFETSHDQGAEADDLMRIPQCLHDEPDCWEDVHFRCQDRANVDCVHCVHEFEERGGCADFVACMTGTCEDHQWEAMMSAIPDGCDTEVCEDYAHEVCFRHDIDCEFCAGGFANYGGCDAWRDCEEHPDGYPEGCELTAYLPHECNSDAIGQCEEIARHVCFHDDDPIECPNCAAGFAASGGCELLRLCEETQGAHYRCNEEEFVEVLPDECEVAMFDCLETVVGQCFNETTVSCSNCASEFYMNGGCGPLQQCEEVGWDAHCPHDEIMSAVPAECQAEACEEDVYNLCFGDAECQPAECRLCSHCAAEFQDRGGCDVWRQCEEHGENCDTIFATIPVGCHHCDEAAYHQCFGNATDKVDRCARCALHLGEFSCKPDTDFLRLLDDLHDCQLCPETLVEWCNAPPTGDFYDYEYYCDYVCSAMWEPVCVVNAGYLPYANACFAECHGHHNYIDGHCDDLADGYYGYEYYGSEHFSGYDHYGSGSYYSFYDHFSGYDHYGSGSYYSFSGHFSFEHYGAGSQCWGDHHYCSGSHS